MSVPDSFDVIYFIKQAGSPGVTDFIGCNGDMVTGNLDVAECWPAGLPKSA